MYKKLFKIMCREKFVDFLEEKGLSFKKIKVKICPADLFLSAFEPVIGIVDDEYYLYIMYDRLRKVCNVMPASVDPKGKTRDWLEQAADYDDGKDDSLLCDNLDIESGDESNISDSQQDTVFSTKDFEKTMYDIQQKAFEAADISDDYIEAEFNKETGEVIIKGKKVMELGKIEISNNKISNICYKNSVDVKINEDNIIFMFDI